MDKDDEVVVVATVIHRSGGSAWRGAVGKVLKRSGDGYQIRFPDFVADNVKESEIDKK
jgi:hypothetical protein